MSACRSRIRRTGCFPHPDSRGSSCRRELPNPGAGNAGGAQRRYRRRVQEPAAPSDQRSPDWRFQLATKIAIMAASRFSLLAPVLAGIDLVRREDDEIRGPKLAWAGAILIPTVGPTAYWWVGRTPKAPPPPGQS